MPETVVVKCPGCNKVFRVSKRGGAVVDVLE